jgi:hypothetical protein
MTETEPTLQAANAAAVERLKGCVYAALRDYSRATGHSVTEIRWECVEARDSGGGWMETAYMGMQVEGRLD